MESSHPPSRDSSSSRSQEGISTAVWIGTFLAWVGVCLCFVLLRKEAFHSFLCPTNGSCENVLNSPYAEVRGIPLPWLGGAFYLALLFLWLGVIGVVSQPMRLRLLGAILWLALAGLTFSAGLMYIQFAVLHAFCPLCTGSAVTIGGLFFTTLRARRTAATAPNAAAPAASLMLGLFALVPLLIFLASHFSEQKTSGDLRTIDLARAHYSGPKDAPVQLVVYSDFQCNYCRELSAVLKRLHAEFPQQVAIVYRHFPLAGHPRAIPAAIAAECAAEQGAFWDYHDKLFEEGGDLSDARLLELATALGLDRARFEACLQSQPPREAVEASLREAEDLALPGAPFVFVNGRRLDRAPTYENLRAKIQELLPHQAPSKETPSR